PFARALFAVADLEFAAWMAHIRDLAPEPGGSLAQDRNVGEPMVQAARQVHAELERPDEQALPALSQDAAPRCRTDDDCLDPGRGGFLDRHVGELQIGLAARHPELPEADLRPPERDPGRGLGGELVMGVADEQQGWSAQG